MYRTIVRRRVLAAFAALSRGDYEPALAGMAPRFEHTFAGSHPAGGTRHTPEAMRRWFERLFRLNRDLSFTIKHVAVAGPPWDTTAVVEWRDTAVLATGADYVNDGVHVVRMRWTRVVSLHAYLDTEVFGTACRQMAEAGVAEAGAAPIVDQGGSSATGNRIGPSRYARRSGLAWCCSSGSTSCRMPSRSTKTSAIERR